MSQEASQVVLQVVQSWTPHRFFCLQTGEDNLLGYWPVQVDAIPFFAMFKQLWRLQLVRVSVSFDFRPIGAEHVRQGLTCNLTDVQIVSLLQAWIFWPSKGESLYKFIWTELHMSIGNSEQFIISTAQR